MQENKVNINKLCSESCIFVQYRGEDVAGLQSERIIKKYQDAQTNESSNIQVPEKLTRREI